MSGKVRLCVQLTSSADAVRFSRRSIRPRKAVGVRHGMISSRRPLFMPLISRGAIAFVMQLSLLLLQSAEAEAKPLPLCIETPPKVQGASPLQESFRSELLALEFFNLEERWATQCNDPQELQLRGLKVTQQGASLVVSGEFYRPGFKVVNPGRITCSDCAALADGAKQALGLFLNDTLLNWDWGLLGVFQIESCEKQLGTLFAKLKLTDRATIRQLELGSYGVGELSWLDKNKVNWLKPIPISLEHYRSPPEIVPGQSFDAQFNLNTSYTGDDLSGFAKRYCLNFQGKSRRLLAPVHQVNKDYKRYASTSAGFVWTSSSVTPSGGPKK